MSAVHFILQGKGGVGKSFAAVLLAQYLKSKDRQIVCADTDPVNATFTKYKSLNVAHVDIVENGRVMHQKFDLLIDKIIMNDVDFIIDNGAATFLPLTTYMKENDIFDLLAENGKKVYMHNVLTAGQAQEETLTGFETLANTVNGAAKIVLWENEYWGRLDYDGYPVTALKVYKSHKDKIAGTVKIAQQLGDDFISSVKQMNKSHMTFDDVNASSAFPIASKSRVRKVIKGVFEELEKVEW